MHSLALVLGMTPFTRSMCHGSDSLARALAWRKLIAGGLVLVSLERWTVHGLPVGCRFLTVSSRAVLIPGTKNPARWPGVCGSTKWEITASDLLILPQRYLGPTLCR